jgi:hypothetical protein
MQKKKSIKTDMRNQERDKGIQTKYCQCREKYVQTTKEDDSMEWLYELQKLAAWVLLSIQRQMRRLR